MRTPNAIKWGIGIGLALLLLIPILVVAAQSGYTLQRWVIGSGGSTALSSGSYRLSGTLGQPIAGGVQAGTGEGLNSGFWYGGTISYRIYLPAVLRAYK